MRSIYLCLTDFGVDVYGGHGYVHERTLDPLRVDLLHLKDVLTLHRARRFHVLPQSETFASRWRVSRQTEDRAVIAVDEVIQYVADARFAQLLGIHEAPVGDLFVLVPGEMR